MSAARRLLAALEERTDRTPRTLETLAREAAKQVILRAAPDQRQRWCDIVMKWAAKAENDEDDPEARVLRWESRHAARMALASFSAPISETLMHGTDEESMESFRRALEGELEADASSLHILEHHIALRARKILARDAESLAAEEA